MFNFAFLDKKQKSGSNPFVWTTIGFNRTLSNTSLDIEFVGHKPLILAGDMHNCNI